MCFGAQAQQDSSRITMDRLGKEDFTDKKVGTETVVTSASRNAKNLENLPFTAYVITDKMITERGYQTLVDVLNDLPGTRVSQPGSAIHGETFSLRGLFGNYYTKILVDNVPIQPSATNGMPLDAQLPIQSVERIEVIYGPAADVYGADAMAGVINIITKESEQINWGNASLIMGSPYLSGIKFTVGGKIGKRNRVFKYSAFGGYRQMRDKNITRGYEEVYNPVNFRLGDNPYYLNNPNYSGTETAPDFNGLPSNSAHLGLRLSGKKLTLGFDGMLRNEHSAIGLNPLYSTYHNPNTKMGEHIFRGFAAYNTKIKKWNSRTFLSWLSYRMDRASSRGTLDDPLFLGTGIPTELFYAYSYGASDDIYFEETVNYGWQNGLSFQAGVTFQYSGNFPNFNYLDEPFNPSDYSPWANEIKNSPVLELLNIRPFNYSNTSAMAQMYYDKNKWQAMFGLRYDYNSAFGSALNPRFGASYKVKPNHILRSSVSTAFRPPSSYLIFNSLRSVPGNPALGIIPTPQFDLKPEQLISLELGWKWLISENSQVDVVAYAHQTENHIVKTLSDQNGDLFYGYQNGEESLSGLSGLQLEYTFKNLGALNWYSNLSVNYSVGYEDLPFDQGRISSYREMPNWIGKWLMGCTPLPRFGIGLRQQITSSWLSSSVFNSDLAEGSRIDGYYTIDILVNYDFTENIKLFANVYNANNAKYGGISAVNDIGVPLTNDFNFTESLYLNPQMGARFTLGVNVQF